MVITTPAKQQLILNNAVKSISRDLQTRLVIKKGGGGAPTSDDNKLHSKLGFQKTENLSDTKPKTQSGYSKQVSGKTE